MPASDSFSGHAQHLNFPKNFFWGVATAAAQIEGPAFEDAKGRSIRHRFARIPGKVLNGDTLDVANDHRYPQAFALMRKHRHQKLLSLGFLAAPSTPTAMAKSTPWATETPADIATAHRWW